ncbi:DUF6211 family protein [Streptomyces sp. NPDC002913]
MVEQTPSTPNYGPPQPYDTVYLKTGNAYGITSATPLIVADAPEDAPGVYELHHLETHPGYWDWAAGVRAEDIATVVRIVEDAAHSWSPTP